MSHIIVQPQELGFSMSVFRASQLIGWDVDVFTPPQNKTTYYEKGRQHLENAGRLVTDPESGQIRYFDPQFSAMISAMVSPQIVLAAFSKEGRFNRRLISYLTTDQVVQMLQVESGFQLTRLPSLAVAAGSALSFCGIPVSPPDPECRLDANHAVFSKIQSLIKTGKAKSAIPALVKLGASEVQAVSILSAMGNPVRSGLLSLMYCGSGVVQDAETYSFFVGKDGKGWMVFPPAQSGGPMVLEQTSLAGLVARLLVTVASRAIMPF